MNLLAFRAQSIEASYEQAQPKSLASVVHSCHKMVGIQFPHEPSAEEQGGSLKSESAEQLCMRYLHACF